MIPSDGASHGPLESSASQRLIDSAHRTEIEGATELWRGFTLADLAHLCMLHDRELISREVLESLVQGVLELHDDPPDRRTLDPGLGDLYRNREHRLDQLGARTGWLGLGRPRREVTTLAFQVTVRRLCLELVDSALSTQAALVEAGESYRSVLMPDYTYNQRAQPTTFGHYILGFVPPLNRDLTRLKQLFDRLNRCPAGTGSTNGSRLPLDRNHLAELLGFDGLVSHARDAMWQPDLPIEVASVLLSLTTNLARLASDLQIFSTREFRFVELADHHSRSSVMMPQKKNPYSLAYIRGVSGEIAGVATSMASFARTSTGQVDNRQFPYYKIPRSLGRVRRTLDLAAEVVSDLSVNPGTMRRAADDVFMASTDLAEYLVLEHGIDYRSSHQIVGAVVRRQREEDPSPREFDVGLINQVSEEVLGEPLGVTRDEVNRVVDPQNLVESRTTPGGASEPRLEEMIQDFQERRTWFQEHLESMRQPVEEAESKLLDRARAIDNQDA